MLYLINNKENENGIILILTEQKIWKETEKQTQGTVVLNTGTENHIAQPYRMLRHKFGER